MLEQREDNRNDVQLTMKQQHLLPIGGNWTMVTESTSFPGTSLEQTGHTGDGPKDTNLAPGILESCSDWQVESRTNARARGDTHTHNDRGRLSPSCPPSTLLSYFPLC